MNLRDSIISFMKKEAYKPMTFDELSEAFDMTNDKKADRLQKIVDGLTQEGQIVKNRKGYYGVPDRMNLEVGTIEGKQKGFAFLIPDQPGSSDIFISPTSLKGALHRDRVVVRVHKEEKQNRKPEGEVVRILERGLTQVVGEFDKDKNYGFVVPDDNRIFQDVFIGKEDVNGAKNGDKVVCKIVHWPMKKRKNPEGVITKVLGDPEDPGVDIETIIHKYGLKEEFPKQVKKQVKNIPEELTIQDREGRQDLTGILTVTIDGEDAKDFDDAVSLLKLDNGNLRVGVHIADVSYYVEEGTPLDKEAQDRGTSVYLVDRVIPMLPEKLSNEICSLNPEVDRLTFSVIMDLTPDGKVVDYQYTPSIINSNHRMTYNEVNQIFDGDDKLQEQYGDVSWMLFEMKQLAKQLRERRFKDGAIDFEFDEAKIDLDESGNPVNVEREVRGDSEKLIEEFMLLTNRVVAKHFQKLDIPFIYRVHEEPDEEKVEAFREFVSKFGYHLPKVEEELHPSLFQNILDQAKGKREERAVSTMMLRSMQQARYTPDCLGHFGLAFQYYSHFTSPIRRYSDLVIHRIMREMLEKEQMRKSRKKKLYSKLDSISYNASLREQEATEAERDSTDYKMAEYMEQYIGEEFDGVIGSITSFGMFVELDNLVEGLVHVSSMSDDYYIFDESIFALIGERTRTTYRIGDEVRVKVIKTSKDEQQIDFELVEN